MNGCLYEIGRISGRAPHVHADDLLSVGQTAVWQSIDSFEGRDGAPFGAFAEIVARNAMRDYVRKEIRADVPVEDITEPAGWIDPTDAWVAWIDFKDALPKTTTRLNVVPSICQP